MFLLLVLLRIQPSLSSDFPFFAQPRVAFRERKLSKYFDLSSNEWRNYDSSYPSSYAIEFCRLVYPGKDIAKVEHGEFQTLTFCNVKDPTKCRSFDRILVWRCMSQSSQITTSPPSTTQDQMSSFDRMRFQDNFESTGDRCVNETIDRVSFDECTPVEHIMDKERCAGENRTFNSIKDIQPCNVTSSDREQGGETSGAGRVYGGFTYAEIQCCSTLTSRDYAQDRDYDQDDGTISTGKFQNPFLPVDDSNEHDGSASTEAGMLLPLGWCALDEVERERERKTANLVEEMNRISTTNATLEADPTLLIERYKEMQETLNSQVKDLFSEHYKCMLGDLSELQNETRALLVKLSGTTAFPADNEPQYLFRLDQAHGQMTEYRSSFDNLLRRLIKDDVPDFTVEYREIVRLLHVVRVDLEKMVDELTQLDSGVDCENGVECPTDGGLVFPNIPDMENRITDAPGRTPTAEGALSEEALIVIVSVVSAITIIVALVFFLIVVRRTFQKSGGPGVRAPASSLAHTDLLTNEQYVAFLQKNGYANPTCRLPQRYLSEK